MSHPSRHLALVPLALCAFFLASPAGAQGDPCGHNPVRDFGEFQIGSHVFGSFRVWNDSYEPIQLTPQLAEPNDQFHVAGQQTTIPPGGDHTFDIDFFPTVRGYHEAVVDLGNDLCTDLLVTGVGLGMSCVKDPEPLDLGTLVVGESTTTWVTITNDGDLPLDLSPQTLTAGAAVSSNAIHLEVGESGQLEILFAPQRPLAFAGIIDWGIVWPSECSALSFSGSAFVNMDPGQDHVGMFFDPSFQDLMPNTTEPNAIVTGYLVLTDPSSDAGVGAWECAAAVSSGGFILDWTLEGNAVNAGTGNELIVGLGFPLPSAPQILLATCQILIPDPEPVVAVSLTPVTTPTIPGRMSWIPADAGGQPRVMLPFSTLVEVAWFNLDEPPGPSPVPEAHPPVPRSRLAGNTPNPFNPATEIRYETAWDGMVHLAVFDMRGRLVRRLVEGFLPAGNHTATWDGRDDAGRGLASGSYFVRLEAGPDADLHKVLLLK